MAGNPSDFRISSLCWVELFTYIADRLAAASVAHIYRQNRVRPFVGILTTRPAARRGSGERTAVPIQLGALDSTLVVFRWPVTKASHTVPIILDLGEVRELASIAVNGKAVGTVWRAPFRVDITNVIRRGENTIAINVANLVGEVV